MVLEKIKQKKNQSKTTFFYGRKSLDFRLISDNFKLFSKHRSDGENNDNSNATQRTMHAVRFFDVAIGAHQQLEKLRIIKGANRVNSDTTWHWQQRGRMIHKKIVGELVLPFLTDSKHTHRKKKETKKKSKKKYHSSTHALHFFFFLLPPRVWAEEWIAVELQVLEATHKTKQTHTHRSK